ncbi:MAG: DUF5688 family protein [Clostridiales bacterium]|nr:DUF5688 family protein [Clostridiales bacterium]
MTYEAFKEAVLNRLSDDIPNPKQIMIQSVCKNNGKYLDGLIILENKVNIAPTIYLNYYYDYYLTENDFLAAYGRILENYRTNKTNEHIDVRFFTDFDKTESRIVLKLIHYDRNRRLLQDIPHIPFLDLAIVFYCYIPLNSDSGNATILIRNSHLQMWQQTTQMLYPLALENSKRLLAPKLCNMNSLLKEMLPDQNYPTVAVPDDPLYPMYVLTNTQNMFGASCLIYDDLIRSYAEQFQSDFYVLPSSIHEIILVPAFQNDRMKDFSEMVREVNETQISQEEFLSDHAYYYSRDKNQLLYDSSFIDLKTLK